jgi:tetratricopeptide (TPR) repeat protein
MVRACSEQACALFKQLGERYGSALAMRKISACERQAGHFREAIMLAQEGCDILTSLGRPVDSVESLAEVGLAQFESGDQAAAAGVLTRVAAEARSRGFGALAAHACYWLARAHLALGQHGAAAAAAAELSEFARAEGHQTASVYACHARGLLAQAADDLTAARAEYRAGLVAARRIGDPLMQVRLRTDLGTAYLDGRRPEEAVAMLAEAVTLSKELGFPLPRAWALQRFGDACAATGNIDGARGAWAEAAALFAGIEVSEPPRAAHHP